MEPLVDLLVDQGGTPGSNPKPNPRTYWWTYWWTREEPQDLLEELLVELLVDQEEPQGLLMAARPESVTPGPRLAPLLSKRLLHTVCDVTRALLPLPISLTLWP